MSRYVDLGEKVTAQFYDEQYEEWTQQTVTIEDVLDSVCDEYTVLSSTQPDADWSYDADTKQITLVVPDEIYESAKSLFLSIGKEGACFGIRGKVLSAQPAQQWIPCSEKLPDPEAKIYWVCTDTGYQCQCRWTNINHIWTDLTVDWHWHIMDVPQYSEVVAWMSLPEPYKENKDERD